MSWFKLDRRHHHHHHHHHHHNQCSTSAFGATDRCAYDHGFVSYWALRVSFLLSHACLTCRTLHLSRLSFLRRFVAPQKHLLCRQSRVRFLGSKAIQSCSTNPTRLFLKVPKLPRTEKKYNRSILNTYVFKKLNHSKELLTTFYLVGKSIINSFLGMYCVRGL